MIAPGTLNLASLEQKYQLPAGLLAAVMKQESGGNPRAVSPKGALGAFQFMPATAKQYNIDPLDPVQAADGAARMYADLGKKYNGDIPSMLAAYNWGQGNVDRKGLQNAPTETRQYVQNISQNISKSSDDGLPDGFVVDSGDSELPDGFQLDGVQPEQEALKEQPSTLEDVAKSIGSNLVGGGLDLAMTLPNLINQAAAGPQLLGRGLYPHIMKGAKAIGFAPEDVRERSQEELNQEPLWQPFAGSGDIEKFAGTTYDPKTTAGQVAAFPARLAGSLIGAKGVDKANNALVNYGNKAPILAADDIKALANDSYKVAEQRGGILKPNVVNKFIDDVDSLAPQTAEGKLLAGDNALTQTSAAIKQFRDKPLTLRSAQEIDEILGDKIDNFVDKTTGALSKEGKKLLDVQTAFRKNIDDAVESDMVGSGFDSWKQGKQLWSAQAKTRDIEKIINRASMMENPVTGVKTGFRTLANNPSRMRGFTAAEQAAIKHAAKTGVPTGALKFMGSRLISSMTGAIAGAAGGGPVGAALGMIGGAAAGTPFREAANALQMRRANDVLSKISNRPAVQSAAGFKPKTSVNRNPDASRVIGSYLESVEQRNKREKP